MTVGGIASLLAIGSVLAQYQGKRITRGEIFTASVKAKFLGKSQHAEEKTDEKQYLDNLASLALINCRPNRIVRAYSVNQGVNVVLQTPIPQTCPGDSDTQIEQCAEMGKYIPLGKLPANTPINMDMMMTDNAGNGQYIQRIIQGDSLNPTVLNLVSLVNPGP